MKLLSRILTAVALTTVGSIVTVAQSPSSVSIPGGAGRVVASPTAPIAVTFYESRLAQDSDVFVGNGLAVLDLVAGGVLVDLAGGDLVTSAAFSPDGSLLAVSYTNGDVALWDTASWSAGAQYSSLVLETTVLGFTSDNRTLVLLIPGVVPQIQFIDVTSGYVTKRVGRKFASRSEFMAAIDGQFGTLRMQVAAAAVSADGARVATVSPLGEIRIYDTVTGDWFIARPEDEQPRFPVRQLAFGDGTLVYGLDSGDIVSFDIEARAEDVLFDVGERLLGFTLSADATRIAAIGREPYDAVVFDTTTNSEVSRFDVGSVPPVVFAALTNDNLTLLMGVAGTTPEDSSVRVFTIGQ